MKFSEILQRNREIGKTLIGEEYSVSLLSNIIINQFNPILELKLRNAGINAKAESGDYDNILQDSVKVQNSKLVIVFWELANIIDGFQYRSNLLTKEVTEEFILRIQNEIDLIFLNLSSVQLVVINRFSTLAFNHHFINYNNFDLICKRLNDYLSNVKPSNTVIIEIDKIIAKISIDEAFDFRNYYSSKSLYSTRFLKEYANFICPLILSVKGKAKKAIIFDCDNTLWNGVLGEDGWDGINMSSSTPKGVVFEEVQFLAKELAAKGIIVGLNSKNNLDDIIELFDNHRDLNLTNDEISIKRINWNDKVTNLNEIIKDLNLGRDSVVFVDDSDFEINIIKQYLPEVVTIQVPKDGYKYPQELRKNLHLFYNLIETGEDLLRTKMYLEEINRVSVKSNFESIESYLKSLELKLMIYINSEKLIPRMAQLTQKTNQFNFTTKRYTEADIKLFIQDSRFQNFAFSVKDKYGEFGVTGVLILEISSDIAIIDTFLMSCRVLGRNLEFKFLDEIFKKLEEDGIKKICASYIQTQKNTQVKDFYEKIGFICIEESANNKSYEVLISDYKYYTKEYINVNYER